MRFVSKSEHGRWGNTNYTSAAELRLITNDNISKIGWTLHSVDSEAEGNPATDAFDGDINTIWHTPWGIAETTYPHEIAINLGALYCLTGFGYLPRQDDNQNGIIKDYIISVSTDGVNWEMAAEGSWGNSYNEKRVALDSINAQYLKLTALSEINNKAYASAAEISLYGEKVLATGINGLEDKNLGANIVVYPNPAKDKFCVVLNEMKNAVVSVYSINGNCLSRTKANQSVVRFQTEPLFKSGMYVVKVDDEYRNSYRKKLIVE